MPVEKEGFPTKSAHDVRDVFGPQPNRKRDVARFDGAGPMQDPIVIFMQPVLEDLPAAGRAGDKLPLPDAASNDPVRGS